MAVPVRPRPARAAPPGSRLTRPSGPVQPRSESAARWDERYGATASPFGDAPSPLVASFVESPPTSERPAVGATSVAARPFTRPVRALLLADGDGRNSTWLATRGLLVVAVDHSEAAVRLASARDVAAGVHVERHVAGLDAFASSQRFDLVALIYFQATPCEREQAVRLAVRSLAPGGTLLVEGFATGASASAPLGPPGDGRRWDPPTLTAQLGALDILECRVEEVTLAEGPRHTGRGRRLSLVARRGKSITSSL